MNDKECKEEIHVCRCCKKEVPESVRKDNQSKFIKKVELCKYCYEKFTRKLMGSYVYLCFDKEKNELAYVGQTTSYKQRMSNHVHSGTTANIDEEDFFNNDRYSIKVYEISHLFYEDFKYIIIKSSKNITKEEEQIIEMQRLSRLYVENKLIEKYKLNQKLSNLQKLSKLNGDVLKILDTNKLDKIVEIINYKCDNKKIYAVCLKEINTRFGEVTMESEYNLNYQIAK